MKKIIALVFVGSLALAGCNSVTPNTTTTTTPTVKDFQSAVVTACGFLPAATTIASILTANPAVATGGQIADIICKAVTAKSSYRGSYAPKSVIVNGKVILINGEFVK